MKPAAAGLQIIVTIAAFVVITTILSLQKKISDCSDFDR